MSLTFTPLAEADLPMLHAWLNRPHVAAWWDDRLSMAEVEEDFLPMITGEDPTRAYIARLDGEPIGYLQCYTVLGSGDGWWEQETDPGARGLDQFLADGDRLGQGLGTRMIRTFVDGLFEDPAVTRIQVDPDPANGRAIACYRKVGFQDVGTVDTPDGPALLMYLSRSS